jgi:hypothetical protein
VCANRILVQDGGYDLAEIGGGSTIAVASLAPPRQSTGRF